VAEEGLLHLQLGESLEPSSGSRRRHLDAAQALFARVGARRELTRIEDQTGAVLVTKTP
jgi:hypothetical protein